MTTGAVDVQLSVYRVSVVVNAVVPVDEQTCRGTLLWVVTETLGNTTDAVDDFLSHTEVVNVAPAEIVPLLMLDTSAWNWAIIGNVTVVFFRSAVCIANAGESGGVR